MIDLIDREAVREFIKSYSHSTDVVYHMEKQLYEVPTIDAVPVVRCKECDNWATEFSSGRKSLGNYRCICQEWSDAEDHRYVYTGENEYCSRGERREG